MLSEIYLIQEFSQEAEIGGTGIGDQAKTSPFKNLKHFCNSVFISFPVPSQTELDVSVLGYAPAQLCS